MSDKPNVLYADRQNRIVVPDYRGRPIRPGDTVCLRSPHPHAGRRGVYQWVERTAIKWMCLVWFDDGDGCYVAHASEWEKVKS